MPAGTCSWPQETSPESQPLSSRASLSPALLHAVTRGPRPLSRTAPRSPQRPPWPLPPPAGIAGVGLGVADPTSARVSCHRPGAQPRLSARECGRGTCKGEGVGWARCARLSAQAGPREGRDVPFTALRPASLRGGIQCATRESCAGELIRQVTSGTRHAGKAGRLTSRRARPRDSHREPPSRPPIREGAGRLGALRSLAQAHSSGGCSVWKWSQTLALCSDLSWLRPGLLPGAGEKKHSVLTVLGDAAINCLSFLASEPRGAPCPEGAPPNLAKCPRHAHSPRD